MSKTSSPKALTDSERNEELVPALPETVREPGERFAARFARPQGKYFVVERTTDPERYLRLCATHKPDFDSRGKKQDPTRPSSQNYLQYARAVDKGEPNPALPGFTAASPALPGFTAARFTAEERSVLGQRVRFRADKKYNGAGQELLCRVGREYVGHVVSMAPKPHTVWVHVPGDGFFCERISALVSVREEEAEAC